MVDVAFQPTSVALRPARSRSSLRSAMKRKSTMAFFMTLPLILLIAVMVAYPAGYAVHLATLNKAMTKFVGFGNFLFLFKRETFWMVVQQSCIFAITAVIFKALIGFIVAHFVHNIPAKGQRKWRGILMVPWVIPPAMSTLAWLWLFDPSYSAFNWILDLFNISRKAKIDEGTEYYSFVRALQSIDTADVALLVIDATVGITHQDQRLAERVDAAGCPVVVLLNKWETLDAEAKLDVMYQVGQRLHFLGESPVLKISALTGKGVHRLLPALAETIVDYHKRMPTRKVNEVIRGAQSALG